MADQKSWRCLVCGYIHVGPQPPDFCPVCGSPASEFETYVDESQAVGKKAYRRWRCLNCGYVHEGETPPETCPVCGEPSESFQPVEPDEEHAGGEGDLSDMRIVIVGSGIAD